MWGRWLVLFCLCCRLVLIQRETLSMLMGIVCPRSFLQRFILLSTSLKGSSFHNMFSLVASCYSTCNLCLLFGRYICSSGEKETKSVISLFDEFMASWVINKTAIFSYCYMSFFSFSWTFSLCNFRTKGIQGLPSLVFSLLVVLMSPQQGW